MSVIVRDDGFHAEDFDGDAVLDLASDTSVDALPASFDGIGMIRVAFPAFNDGRAFTVARKLRMLGYTGQLLAFGPVIADQYAMLRRVGFDGAEIPAEIAARQPAEQWQFRAADWQANHYQARLRA